MEPKKPDQYILERSQPLTETPPLLEIAFPFSDVRFRWLAPVLSVIAASCILTT